MSDIRVLPFSADHVGWCTTSNSVQAEELDREEADPEMRPGNNAKGRILGKSHAAVVQ